MFEVLLMRHAKSDWHSHSDDIDRPLNRRGRDDAVRTGAYLKQNNLLPDKVLVSVAQRTRETAQLLLNSHPLAAENIIIDPSLYLADRETLIESIELYAKDNQRLLILAHNPGMDDAVSYLTSTAPPLSAKGKLMTTCALACFRMESLDAVSRSGRAELFALIRPDEI